MSDGTLVLLLALLAGALSVDGTAAFQLMFSQPLVAGSLAGLVVGDPLLGLTIGGTLQLVWIVVLPVGAAAFPDAALAGVVGVGLAGLLSRAGAPAGWSVAAGIIVALVSGAVGQRAIAVVRRLNVRYAAYAARRARLGDPGGVRVAVALGIATRFVVGAMLAGAILGLSFLALEALPFAPPRGTFPTALWAAPLAAAGIAAAARTKTEWLFMGAGLVFGVIVLAGR